MRLLLDTHIFLWFVSGDRKLALALREVVRDPQNEIFLSVVSLWESIIKHHLGHLPLPQPASRHRGSVFASGACRWTREASSRSQNCPPAPRPV
jgi:PIN domain nuclease of toxin-antitoxin system